MNLIDEYQKHEAKENKLDIQNCLCFCMKFCSMISISTCFTKRNVLQSTKDNTKVNLLSYEYVSILVGMFVSQMPLSVSTYFIIFLLVLWIKRNNNEKVNYSGPVLWNFSWWKKCNNRMYMRFFSLSDMLEMMVLFLSRHNTFLEAGKTVCLVFAIISLLNVK